MLLLGATSTFAPELGCPSERTTQTSRDTRCPRSVKELIWIFCEQFTLLDARARRNVLHMHACNINPVRILVARSQEYQSHDGPKPLPFHKCSHLGKCMRHGLLQLTHACCIPRSPCTVLAKTDAEKNRNAPGSGDKTCGCPWERYRAELVPSICSCVIFRLINMMIACIHSKLRNRYACMDHAHVHALYTPMETQSTHARAIDGVIF